MSYIIANNLVKKYGEGEIAVSAIDGINFEIEEGEFVG
ncbi:MAG: ABC transporter ATP-binding protein, partial [Deltaproteobacteria bacterium]|nr:ABC transporter ATP-binding protein [Deltaproteobacteria bacterium]